jgi:hypothetical protein
MWVLPLRETFLIQMDDFDRLLESQLRRKLNPIVAAPVPPRRDRLSSKRDRLSSKKDRRAEPAPRRLGAIPIDLRPDALVFVEHS